MTSPYATVQAGSGIIGDASGTTVIVESAAADQFGEGATLIVWPSGKDLDANVRNYETMLVASKSGATLTVVRGTADDPTGLSTFAAGDQVALSFPVATPLPKKQTQVITVGKTDGFGPAVDLGADSLGIVGITASIKDVNLDGGSPPYWIQISVGGSFGGVNWDVFVTEASGAYRNPSANFYDSKVVAFTADDPAPLYSQALMPRYLRFGWAWLAGDGGLPADLGAAASAAITFELDYF